MSVVVILRRRIFNWSNNSPTWSKTSLVTMATQPAFTREMHVFLKSDHFNPLLWYTLPGKP